MGGLPFSLFAGYFAGSVFKRDTISNVFLFEDVLERQNCYGDERISSVNRDFNPYDKDFFDHEFSLIFVKIRRDLNRFYGLKEGGLRTASVESRLRDWLFLNFLVESYLAGIRNQADWNSEEFAIIKDLFFSSSAHEAENYRLLVNRKWLSLLLTVLADGDFDYFSEATTSRLLAGTMLLQLSEDFINFRRDKRIGKKSFFTGQKSFFFRFFLFLRYGWQYSGLLSFSFLSRLLTVILCVIRTLPLSFLVLLFKGDLWRRKKFFERCDILSEKEMKKKRNNLPDRRRFP